MDVCRRNPFSSPAGRNPNAPAASPRSAFLEFGSTTIKLYLPRLSSTSESKPGAGSGFGASGDFRIDGATVDGGHADAVRVPWELGHDVFQTGRIRDRTIDHCICVLRTLQDRFPEVDFPSTPAVGTAALRVAANADCLQEAVRETLDLRIHVIDGAIEAHLLASGFRDSVIAFPTALFDLGGGSLELVQYLDPETTTTSSLPLGAIRLHCSLEHIRNRASYAAEGERLAAASLGRHLNGTTSRYGEVFGTGGTVRSVLRLIRKDTLSPDDITLLKRRALDDDLDDLEPHRREVFLAGILIVEALFERLDVERIVYRGAAVRRELIDLACSLDLSGNAAS